MSTNYGGNPGLIVQGSAVNISSSTNATPSVVTTSSAHGLSDGDFVQITGHGTNTKANGIRRIAVLTSTTFELYDPSTLSPIAAAAAGGATGTVVPYTAGTYAIPADSDNPKAATWNPAFEALGDRTAWAGFRLLGSLTLAQVRDNHTSDATNAAWTGSTSYAATTWTNVTNTNAFISAGLDLDVFTGDVIDVSFSTSVLVASSNFGFALFVHVYDYGTSPAFASSVALVGSMKSIGALGVVAPLDLRWRGAINYPAPGLTRGKACRVYVGAYNRGGGSIVADFYGDHSYSAQVWR